METVINTEFSYQFVGGMLALDLVNTETVQQGKRREFLTDLERLRWWWNEAQTHYPHIERVASPPLNEEHLLATVQTFRSILRRMFTAVIAQKAVDQADLDALNKALTLGQRSIVLGTNGSFVKIYRSNDDMSRVMLPLALSAYHLLTEGDLARLHKCQNDTCMRLFYDQTKNATRQWCSPKCLDKVRSRRRYALKKASAGDHDESPPS